MQFRCYNFTVILFIVIICYTNAYVPQTKQEEPAISLAQGMRFPCWSPDGNWIAFGLYGDIWKVPAQGGKAIRLTLHPAEDVKPRWSPDGKKIAFASNRQGNFDIWTVSSDGGIPNQVTFHSAWDSIADWTLDGKEILFYSHRSGELEMWKVPAQGGNPVQLTYDGGRDGSISPDGKNLIYVRGDVSLWIKGYRGTSNWDIYSKSLIENTPPIQLTEYMGNDLYPFFSKNGNTVYFSREDILNKNGEKKSVYNLWKMDLDGKNQLQLTAFDSDISAPAISADGQKIVFEKDFQIWQLSLADIKPENLNTLKITRIEIDVTGDSKERPEITRIISEGNEMASWSPDSKEIAFALQNDIWIMPANGGKARQITSGVAKDQWPRFSPDGKFLAYCSNKSGNDDIFIRDLTNDDERQLTDDKASDFFHSWSPDGKHILFTSERSGNRDIWIVESTGGIARQLTNDAGSEDDAVWSPDGKWIAFDSAKSGQQEIWIMPSNGNYDEAKQLTSSETGLTQVPSWSPDSKWIAYEYNDLRGSSSVWIISISGGKPMQVVSEGSMPCWSPDGKWILYEQEVDDIKNTLRIKAPTGIQFGEKLSFFAEVKVNVAKERLQIFEEAWNAIDKGFYDEKLHGIDWKKIKEIYEPLAKNAQTDMELEIIINKMVGELKASHLGFSMGSESSKVTTGYLGCTLEQMPGYNILIVKDVLPDGPADKAWIRSGDYVYEIAGYRPDEEMILEQVLNGTIGKEIKIFVSPTLNPYQGRHVKVTPVGINEIESLKYQQWVRERMQLVRQACEGKVVYVHLREMNEAYLARFRQIVQKTVEVSEGMILDIRNNGGGNIHQELLDILVRKPYLSYKVREQKKQYQPTLYWNKPIVVIINEKSFSDAEVFPYAFQFLKLGKVVGVPTGGGVIGTKDIKLLNNATFRLPQVGYYTVNSKNLEGMGVQPDILVVETSKDRQEGKDPQLIKAMEVIMDEIAARKRVLQAERVTNSPGTQVPTPTSSTPEGK